MLRICRFVAQQVPVGTGLPQPPVAVPAPLPHGKRQRAVGKLRFDGSHQGAEADVVVPGVLAALQHKGAEAQGISRFAAVEDLLLGHPVAVDVPIVPADAAVEAVVPAVVGKFNEPPQMDLPAEGLHCGFRRSLAQVGNGPLIPGFQQVTQILVGQVMVAGQGPGQQHGPGHDFPPA